MAKFTSRTKVVPLLLLLLLYNEVTGAGSRKRRRSGTDPSEEFSSHRIVTPKLYHGRSKREVTSSRDVHDVTDVTRRHLDRMTVTLGSDDDERQFVLDLKLNRDLIPKNYFQKTHKQVRNASNYLTSQYVPTHLND